MDKNYVFGFDNKVEQSEVVQWLFFWAAGQPMQSQNNWFSRSAPEEVPCKRRQYLIPEFYSYIILLRSTMKLESLS